MNKTNNQPSLFTVDHYSRSLRPSQGINDEPPANWTPTSRAAARSMRDSLSQLQRLALHMLADHPSGLTREELADASATYGRRFQLQTACSIADALLKGGLVRESGTRATSSGRQAAVLVLTVRGFGEARQ